MGHPQKSRKEQRRYTSALPGAQGLGACACSGSGGPLVLARGTFQRDSLRGGERFPRASGGLPRLLSRGVTFLGGFALSGVRGLLRVLVGVRTLLMTIHPVRDAGVSMTFLTAPECSSETLSSPASFYLTVSFSANTALPSECRPATPSHVSALPQPTSRPAQESPPATPPTPHSPDQLYIRFSFVV